jgi:acyl-CoA synthetase (AMP-forming)/AMP-acid ligase II
VNITEPIRRLARLAPQAPAIIRADNSIVCFAEFERAIDRVAWRVGELGLRAGDIVGLAITGPDEALGLILALALARLGVATADPSLPSERLRLAFEAKRPGRPATPAKVVFDAGWLAQGGDTEPPAIPIHSDPDVLCRVFASSGTTGVPKHVPASHRLITRRVFGRWLSLSGGPARRIVGIGLNTALGFETVLRTLWAGGTLVLTNPRDAADAILRHGVTSIVTSPITLRGLLGALPPDMPVPTALTAIEVAGSVLPDAVYKLAAVRLCPNIASVFGSTEADNTAFAPIATLAGRDGAVGYVSPGVEVRAVDANGEPLPAGQEGILCVRSDRVASSYLWDDAASAEAFRDGWFWSGDIGAVWPDGMITLTGRATELINCGGQKVSPQAIEGVLLRLPTVLDAAVFGVPDPMGIEHVGAAIVARARIHDAVLEALCQRVLRDKAPKIILQMKSLPRNANGKVQRRQLAELALHMIRQRGRREPCSTDLRDGAVGA